MSKSLKIIFMLSLFINILGIGIIAGNAKRHMGGHPPPHMIAKKLHQFLEQLPEEKQAATKETIQRTMSSNKQRHHEIRALRKELLAQMTAEEFDSAAYANTFQKIEEKRHEVSKNHAELMQTIAAELSHEERQKLAASLKRKNKHKKSRKERRFKQNNARETSGATQ